MRLLHAIQKLFCISRKRLDITALTLCEEGVESQRTLARPGWACDHCQASSRQIQVNSLEVVLPGSADPNHIFHIRMIKSTFRDRRLDAYTNHRQLGRLMSIVIYIRHHHHHAAHKGGGKVVRV
jgi:hypothetical protein